jgi:protease-4
MSICRFRWAAALALPFLANLPLSARDEEPAKKAPVVARVAHIKLSGSLEEVPVSQDPLFGSLENFKSKLDRIKKAKNDKNIQGLYLQLDGLGVGWGKVDELRAAIADFRKAGKKAFAYLEAGDSKDYLVACACDRVCLPESGWLMLTGVRGEVTFYKGLFDKLGLKADMLQMGAYKGAAEPYTRKKMSKAFRERLESVLDDYFEKSLVDVIAHSRAAHKLTADKVKGLIDEGPFTAKEAVAAGLIDETAYAHDFEKSLKHAFKADEVKFAKNYGKEKSKDLDLSNPFAILKLLGAPSKPRRSTKDKIAVIYATGVIVTGRGGSSLLGGNAVGSSTMVEAIRQAEQDKTVKAIVLRVDSPGGSALASDLIWHELRKSKKPVIASMSDVAASGGYYISMAAQKIFAEPGTLTGSIGVVGGKIVLGGLEKKVGLNTQVITRGKNAAMFSSATPFSESERKVIKKLMGDIYEQFLTKAIQGRERAGKKFTRSDFLKYAEGRIWTGRQAKEIGLVDELGTLNDALAEAKALAKFPKTAEPELLILPRPRSFLDNLLEGKEEASLLKGSPLAALKALPEMADHLRAVGGLLQLRGEHVWLIMPQRVVVR